MAGADDPFTPGESTDPTAGLPDYETFGKVKDQWNTFLDQPGGRAALLSAGLALMQPPSFGDSPMGQIGRAIGAGGEALSRVEAMDLKQKEIDSKATERAATADAATSRASTAEARANTAAAGLDVKREQLKNAQDRAAFQEELRARIAYGKAVDAINRQNAKIRQQNETNKLINGPKATITPELPIPSAEDWIAQSRGAGAGVRMDAPAPGGVPTIQNPAQAGYDIAPKNPGDREDGKTYMGPGGRIGKWDATNQQWIVP
jgi:hypothetical protein